MDISDRPLRIFVFFPPINERTWTVLLPGAHKHLFRTEGLAVEFALNQAVALKGKGRAVQVLKERISGSWIPVHF
jgi:hypothetical protein